MAEASLKEKIARALKEGYFKDSTDLVDVSDGHDDNVHVVIVSRKFDGRKAEEKEDLIWSELSGKLAPDDWGRVTLSVGISPEELKSL